MGCICPSGWPHTHMHMGSINWILRIISKVKIGHEAGWEMGWGTSGSERKVVADGYDQHTLYKCMELLKNRKVVSKTEAIEVSWIETRIQ